MDALKVEAGKRGRRYHSSSKRGGLLNERDPMDIVNIRLGKLTPEEWHRSTREGLCLRCSQKGQLSKGLIKEPGKLGQGSTPVSAFKTSPAHKESL